jgi:two-component system, NarL family, invasion response regulator UvrY
MSSTIIRIMIIDDHQLVRRSWRMLLEGNPSISVIGECSADENVLEKVDALHPDIILADFNNKPHDGFSFAEKLSVAYPDIKLICLSIKKGSQFVHQMMSLGTRGYLTKSTSLEEIHRGILQVYLGETYVCDEVKKHLLV